MIKSLILDRCLLQELFFFWCGPFEGVIYGARGVSVEGVSAQVGHRDGPAFENVTVTLLMPGFSPTSNRN